MSGQDDEGFADRRRVAARYQRQPEDRGILVERCDPTFSHRGYVEMGEFFLTEQITGPKAEAIKAEIAYPGALPTDEVWRFSTSAQSWRHLAGRAGEVLVRGGVVLAAAPDGIMS